MKWPNLWQTASSSKSAASVLFSNSRKSAPLFSSARASRSGFLRARFIACRPVAFRLSQTLKTRRQDRFQTDEQIFTGTMEGYRLLLRGPPALHNLVQDFLSAASSIRE